MGQNEILEIHTIDNVRQFEHDALYFGRDRTVVFVCHITGSNNFFSAARARCRLTLTLLYVISKTSAGPVVLISPMSLSSKTIR